MLLDSLTGAAHQPLPSQVLSFLFRPHLPWAASTAPGCSMLLPRPALIWPAKLPYLTQSHFALVLHAHRQFYLRGGDGWNYWRELHMAEADGVGVHEKSRFLEIVETARMDAIMKVGGHQSCAPLNLYIICCGVRACWCASAQSLCACPCSSCQMADACVVCVQSHPSLWLATFMPITSLLLSGSDKACLCNSSIPH